MRCRLFLTPGCSWVPGSAARPRNDRGRRRGGLQRPPDLLDAVALDDVAGAHVLVVLEGHAALLAGRDLAGVVLEALELAELALVNHHVVADEAHVGAALHDAVEDAAARDLADLGDVEDLQDLRLAEPRLAQGRGEEARHRLL